MSDDVFPRCNSPTLIVTRQVVGDDGRIWLTFDGAIKTTVVMTDPRQGSCGS
jgi:hypothetical protein